MTEAHPGLYARPWQLLLLDSRLDEVWRLPFEARAGANVEPIESPTAIEPLLLRAYVQVPIVGRVSTEQYFQLPRGSRIVIAPGELHITFTET